MNQNNFPKPPASSTFSIFYPLSQTEVLELSKGSPIKACPHDPVPASPFRSRLSSLLPTLISIVNLFLQTGTIPTLLQSAQLTPIIKNVNLDPESLHNYHLISNFSYLSNVVEHVVASQLSSYLTKNNLLELRQSAYRACHSTETAIISVMGDLLLALDDCRPVLLSLLDCSVGFNLVSHPVLLCHIEQLLGITGLAL